MNSIELQIAAHLMQMAADEFGNHGCNDMEWPKNLVLNETHKAELGLSFNAWNGSLDDPIEFQCIGDDSWMAYFADKLRMESGLAFSKEAR